MDKQKRAQWDRILKALIEGKIACCLHLARGYVLAYPNAPLGWVILGDVLAKFARYDEAKKAFQRALKCSPAEVEYCVHQYMGNMYREKSDLKRAEKCYRRSVEMHPKQENLALLGGCLAQQGRFQEAKKLFQQAARKNPKTADEVYLNIGLILRAEGHYKKAIYYFNKAIAIDPKYKEAKSERRDVQELLDILSADKKRVKQVRPRDARSKDA